MYQYPELENLISPTVISLDYEFIGLECCQQGSRLVLRIYVDKQGGFDIKDCEIISKHVGSVLDAESSSIPILAGSYTLEISSPGIARKLFTLTQCQEQVGKVVKLRLKAPDKGQKNFQGQLQAVDGDALLIMLEGEQVVSFSFHNIEKAQVVPTW